jgi:hypothetical protein
MIRTAIKLAFVALLANAVWQLFNAYWPYYKFNDAVRATAQYRGQKTDAQVRERVIELAAQFDVPLVDENLSVRRDDTSTVIDAAYVQPVALTPWYIYPWSFAIHVNADPVTPGRLDELGRPK